MLDMLIMQAGNGLALGFLYVLIALGLSIIFGLLGIVNFAHGVFFALGAYFSLTMFNIMGWWGIPFAMVIVAVIGMITEIVIIRRLYDKEPLVSLIVTFSFSLLAEAVIRAIWGAQGQPFNAPDWLNGIIIAGPFIFASYRVAVMVCVAVILAAFWAFMRFTKYGRILRAGSRDPMMVQLLGINLPHVLTGTFGLGCLLAALAGLLAAPIWDVTPGMGEAAIMPAFVVITIGGLGSYAGAIVAGLAVGLVQSLTIQFMPEASTAAMYVLMAVVLLLRPRGLFGEQWERFE
ncbi:branched-chain amino acid ABC transporter permease [Acidocella sp.]|uniref:branched-chain amino acid ABC transporter permease n=1 Tax=Acidocella sp. TaxID=50710 RepID=UPI002627DFE8|nr:branched-chain amino acid ABC transporter permease [Acidocella sp.]